MTGCPGRDRSSWTYDDIYEVPCPGCGALVELFKDDVCRACPGCGRKVPNPRRDARCADWCPAADRCSLAGPGDRRPGPDR
jgi:hypothetical protein